MKNAMFNEKLREGFIMNSLPPSLCIDLMDSDNWFSISFLKEIKVAVTSDFHVKGKNQVKREKSSTMER